MVREEITRRRVGRNWSWVENHVIQPTRGLRLLIKPRTIWWVKASSLSSAITILPPKDHGWTNQIKSEMQKEVCTENRGNFRTWQLFLKMALFFFKVSFKKLSCNLSQFEVMSILLVINKSCHPFISFHLTPENIEKNETKSNQIWSPLHKVG